MHYKINISYDGLSFNGWQRLKDNPNTIQEHIENALSKYTNTNIKISGSGRTDAGVSAIDQVADFFCNLLLNESDLNNINSLLPCSISINSIVEVPANFHSRKSAISKTYTYCIALDDKPDVFNSQHVYTPHQGSLDIDAMKKCAELLIGTHDFSAFTTDKSKNKSHVRTITSIEFEIITAISNKKTLLIHFTGNGFLYNMVRILAGTIVFAGVGKLDASTIPQIISSKNRQNAGPTLPSNALFLQKVEY